MGKTLATLLFLFSFVNSTASAMVEDTEEPLGGKGLVYQFKLSGSLKLFSSANMGSLFLAAFREGKAVGEEEKIFDKYPAPDFCWFAVYLSNDDYFEYLDTKKYPELIADPIEVDLWESSIQAVNGKVVHVDFSIFPVGSSGVPEQRKALPLHRADGKTTDSRVWSFSCRGQDVRTSTVQKSTISGAIVGSHPPGR